MTTAPPGVLTGKLVPPGCRIAVPGLCHREMIAAAAAYRWEIDETGGRHDGDVVIGLTAANGPVRIHYDTAAQWDALIAAATIIRDWLRGTL